MIYNNNGNQENRMGGYIPSVVICVGQWENGPHGGRYTEYSLFNAGSTVGNFPNIEELVAGTRFHLQRRGIKKFVLVNGTNDNGVRKIPQTSKLPDALFSGVHAEITGKEQSPATAEYIRRFSVPK